MLRNYFRRIGYTGTSHPNIDVLNSVLRHHICAIPFENLDVQFGRPVTTNVDAAYEKIVTNGRGGWCYEQNGLFGLALSEIGFDVTRVAAAVMRQDRGDAAEANHLCLLVRIPGSGDSCLVDVGFGGSMINPIPLIEAEYEQAPFQIGLKKAPDLRWRFWEDDGGGEFSYDFASETADESALSHRCDFLQTDPSSGFVLNMVVQLRTPKEHKSLRGRVLRILSTTGTESRILSSADELLEVLSHHFSLDVPQAEKLWPGIIARHEQVFPD